MRNRIEGAGYYLSCMVLFNVVYGLSILADGGVFEKHCGSYDVAGITTLIVAFFCALLGIVFTIRILTVDDSEKNTISTGKQFEVTSVNDLTGENYFANFSVIVLTGLALPPDPNWFVLSIFLLIEITLGIVYIKKKMYYMNPILSLMNYSIFECTGKDPVTKENYCGTYYFIAKGLQVSVGTIIKYKNINSHVVRLNEEN